MSAVVLDPGMTGFRGANGGYLMAVALRQMLAMVDRPPRSLSAYLLTPVTADAVEVPVTVERAGSSMTTASARIEQDGSTAAIVVGSFGTGSDSVERLDVVMPRVPPPAECRPLLDKPVPGADAGLHVEHRPAAPPLPLTGGDRAEILVWMRLTIGRPVDAFDVALLADSGPPALYGALPEFVAMPSTDITLHFAPAPAEPGEWVLGVFRARVTGDGYATDDGELWTEGGELVLQSRQRRRILGW
jgi:acyl-CoA thioesterase